MSTQQLTAAAMALPLSERVSLAQALWQSINAGLTDTGEREDERLDGVDVEVRGRLVHEEEVRRIDEELDEVQARLLAAAQHLGLLHAS